MGTLCFARAWFVEQLLEVLELILLSVVHVDNHVSACLR